MAIETNPFSEVNVNQVEYGRLVGDHPANAEVFKVKIPKLMIRTNTTRALFNRNIFVNAPSCSVQSKNAINTIDYITIKKAKTCDMEAVAIDGVIKNDTLVACICVTNNVNDLIITGVIK